MKRTPEAPRRFQRRTERTNVWLNLAHTEDGELFSPDRIGHKASSLQQLTRAGIRVPSAFCIPTEIFDEAVDRALAGCHNLDELRDAIEQVEIPTHVLEQIELHCSDGLWAVRSSSTQEDGPALSFAGQADSVLDVEGPEAVARAVRSVWMSAFSERSLTYRIRARLDGEWAKMAVIVQRMVKPTVGGVLFTVNPTDINDEAMVVCAAPGPKPDVVGGAECDTYYVARNSGYLIRQETPFGLLTEEQLKELATVGDRVERLFGSASDIEWGIVDDHLTLLQSRPVTRVQESERTVWSNANVGESLPGVATPLTWSIIEAFSTRGFERAFGTIGLRVPQDAQLAGSFYGRIYLNLSEFVRVARGIPFLTPAMLFEMAGGGGVDDIERGMPTPDYKPFLRNLPKSMVKIVATQLATLPMVKTWNAVSHRQVEVFFSKDLSRLRHDELKTVQVDLDNHFNRTGEVLLTVSSNFMLCMAVASEILKLAGLKEQFPSPADLLDGLHVSSSEAGSELLGLARVARRSIVLRRIFAENTSSEMLSALRKQSRDHAVSEFLKKYDAFIHTYGRRSVREAELATPRWREDSTFVFEVLKGHVALPFLNSTEELKERRRERAVNLNHELEKSFTFAARQAFGVLMQWARVNAGWRETIRARVVDTLDMYRSFFLECGRRLMRQGAIRNVEDVFFLTYDEVSNWIARPTPTPNFRLSVLTRRAQFEAYASVPNPPSTFLFDGQRIVAAKREMVDGDNRLKGLSASPGVMTGTARVIRDLSSASSIQPGEVLVVPYADIGFTPMFLNAAAIVIELGGPLSHAAIVAREYGIPTVVNVSGATSEIPDGATVTVNGSEGWISWE